MATHTISGPFNIYAGGPDGDYSHLGTSKSVTISFTTPEERRMRQRRMPYREWKRVWRNGK